MHLKSNGISYPPSLDETFFTEALEQGLNESKVDLKEVSFEMGSAPGENYCSQIYRVSVTFIRKSCKTPEKLSLIIKSLLTGESVDFMEYMDCFSKERHMYTKIVPYMEVILNNTQLAPICYYTQKLPNGFYVFQDLNAIDYILADREKGLDIQHCELVMKKIAQFHAASIVLARKIPNIFKNFNEGLIGKTAVIGSASLRSIFEGNLEELVCSSKKWPGFEKITPKLQRILNNYTENLIKIGAQRPGEFCVLNHGDLWVNNIMFKYDKLTKKPIDVVFVDLAMGIYSSPGFDLNYFFNTSIPVDILKNKREYLIRYYYDNLKDALEEMNYKEIPTFDLIRQEIDKREDFGFFAAHAIFPIVSLEKDLCGNISCDELADADAGKKRREMAFSGKRLQEQLKYTMKRFDELKVLN